MENESKQHILQLFAEQYNQAIKDNPTLVSTKADPWDGPKPIAKDGFAITLCEVRVVYLYTKKGVNYYQGFDGRECTWKGLTNIEQEIFNKQNSINHSDRINGHDQNDTLER